MELNILDLNKCGIYVIRNIINNKIYIGKSINIHKRIITHKAFLKAKNKNENRHLINAWHKYNEDNFEYFVIEYLEKKETLLAKRELYWMEVFKSYDRSKGYNLRKDSQSKCIVSNETRELLKLRAKERSEDPNFSTAIYSHTYWKDHPEATKKMADKVKIKKHKFSFEQYDRDNNYIKTWFSVEEIIKHNPEYKWQNIYSVCNGYKPTYRGYIWKKIPKINNEEIVRT